MRNYCEYCRHEQRFYIKKEKYSFSIKEKIIDLVRKTAICEACDNIIDVEELENETLHDIQKIYRESVARDAKH